MDLLKGDHRKPKYARLCPLMKVPGMEDGSLSISESVAIMRYLAAKYPKNYQDHWYPADLSRWAKIDEYIAFHHQGMREPLTGLMIKEVFMPNEIGHPLPKEQIYGQVKYCNDSLDIFERVFISNTPFITGDDMSITDALAVNEILDPTVCGRDSTDGTPKLKTYVERIKARLGFIFDEIYKEFYKWKEDFEGEKK